MTPEQIKIISQTVPVVQQYGGTITTVFYKNMLHAHPELKTVFNSTNQKTGHQAKALAAALYAYAANIENLDVLGPALELICQKHASLYITPEQYRIVGKFLLQAMQEVLGDVFTPQVQDAWGSAYWQLANLMITKESSLYEQNSDWKTWRDFRIARIEPESTEIKSFYLEPVDGKPLPKFTPGQYISIRLYVPRLNYTQDRQYSLSDKPNPRYYRISVKREDGLSPKLSGPEDTSGYVSYLLHDMEVGKVVQLSHPRGDFFLQNIDATHPVVLIAAGVGITPLLSMFVQIVENLVKVNRKVHLIHAARDTASRAFKDAIQKVGRGYPTVKTTFFIERPEDSHLGCTRIGRVDLQRLHAQNDLFLDNHETEYYICGPPPFMQSLRDSLLTLGVDKRRIKMELFGTGGPDVATDNRPQANL
ncbi:globin-like protein [Talaromyces proteolyticus]|uniref:nitric oxide dioxygenase n=1 Tax=Talaromyces proteolyticus TaxID=1131652 RepID=A0AAD4KPF5_9EURO|nr:globin-like protein [Talaromyces proteolyticus]KAH8696429.1 globin-like protein [Talaromyces proteolyticus]